MKTFFCLLVCLFVNSAQAGFIYTDTGNAADNGGGSFTMSTGGGPVSGSALESFLGLAGGSLNSLSPSGNPVTEGSALKASIDVMVGDKVTFDWLFSTLEDINDPNFPAVNVRDFAFYSLKLITAGGPLLLADAFVNNTGANGAESFIATATGTLEIGVGVVDVLDVFGNSFITASNFVLDPAIPPANMPEPASIALLGFGLAGIGWSRRRKTA